MPYHRRNYKQDAAAREDFFDAVGNVIGVICLSCMAAIAITGTIWFICYAVNTALVHLGLV